MSIYYRLGWVGILLLAIGQVSPVWAQAGALDIRTTAAQNAATISPSHLEAARALVIGSGMSRSFEAAIPEGIVQLKVTISRMYPALIPDLEPVLEILRPEFAKWPQEMVDQAARIVASYMKEDDLKEASAFFATPAGKAYVHMQPAMMEPLMLSLKEWNTKISQLMVDRVREELKKRGKDM